MLARHNAGARTNQQDGAQRVGLKKSEGDENSRHEQSGRVFKTRERCDLKSGLKRRVIRNEAQKIWIAELAIPMKCLVAKFNPAARWRVNFYRVEGAKEPRFYSAWRPTGTVEPNFHVPEAFGELIFAPAGRRRKYPVSGKLVL